MSSLNLTRIAPTPSGYLHIGNLYSFVTTWLIAKREGAKILLRIDDLDSPRVRTEYIDDIFRTLEFAGLDYDLGPSGTEDFLSNYSQRTRLGLYDNALRTLAENGSVFPCRCSRKLILEAGTDGCAASCAEKGISFADQDASWRFVARRSRVSVIELQGHCIESKIPAAMRQTVLRKRDGRPSYQLANIVDDTFYGVDLIVRGKDLLPSTLVQLAVAEALGEPRFQNTVFHHHDLITRSGEKLSKTQHAPSVRSEFSTREALLTHIAEMFGVSGRVFSLTDIYNIMTDSQNPPFPLTPVPGALPLDNHRSRR